MDVLFRPFRDSFFSFSGALTREISLRKKSPWVEQESSPGLTWIPDPEEFSSGFFIVLNPRSGPEDLS
jgi:hypothetical protein